MKLSALVAIAAVIGTSLITANPAISETVNVTAPSIYSYNNASVKQLKIRGSYGRYIRFRGKKMNSWEGSNGSCHQGSCKAAKSGGSNNRSYKYELDCRDMTFDRKGDRRNADGFKKGWMSIREDPTASAVADKYCPMISSLPEG